ANSESRSSPQTRPRCGRCCAGSPAPTASPAWDGFWNDAPPPSDPRLPLASASGPPLPRCRRGFRALCDRAFRPVGLAKEHLDRLLKGFELALFGLQLLQLLGMPGQHLCAPRANLILHAIDVA